MANATPKSNPITKAVWEGSIPIRFSLDPKEAESFGVSLESCIIQAPRCSYLSLLTSQIRKFFVDLGLQFFGDDTEIWYEYNGTPCKWHYPIGLLYDLLTHNDPSSDSIQALPWRLTVHFENFPANQLIRGQAVDATQDFFFSMVKEADFLMHGSTKKLMNLSKDDQTQLWDGLASNSYERFWSINQRLSPADAPQTRYIPLRVYLPDASVVIQEPLSPFDEDGSLLTLWDALHRLLPDLFPDKKAKPCALPVVHGVIPQMEMPLIWAAQQLSYPDNFLHIVILLKS
ncbi:uncharacterized protein VTP21DRAFT_7883 [Calcarisporiella thermophila]|uniref:uncharacterized protein n=1 Tax=Calcarisporiella thermophila TaxID=911321 RepID=UPI003743FF3F